MEQIVPQKGHGGTGKKECLAVYIGLSGIVFLDRIEVNMIDISSDSHTQLFSFLCRERNKFGTRMDVAAPEKTPPALPYKY